MIRRALSETLLEMAGEYPVVVLTGAKQAGKSTLAKSSFPGYRHISLEDPDEREFARDDPRAFLAHCGTRVILDEAQLAPELFGFILQALDAKSEPGMFVLTVSANSLLMRQILEKNDDRVGVLQLLPLTCAEAAQMRVESDWTWILKGGYPRIYDFDSRPGEHFPRYIRTYLEREVHADLGVRELEAFERFMRACAARIGRPLNINELARECGASAKTARSWLRALQRGQVVRLVPAFWAAIGKRLTRSPKLYFYDTGLVCNLLGIGRVDEAERGAYRGVLFENAVLAELLKARANTGRPANVQYMRDSNGSGVDFIVTGDDGELTLIEAEASSTYNECFFKQLEKFGPLLGVPVESRYVVFGGEERMEAPGGRVLGLRHVHELAE